jgi:hypothetical protein
LEELGFRSIGRPLGVSNVLVLNWIKAFGLEEKKRPSERKEMEIVEKDEMHTYVRQKKLLLDMDCCP